MGELAIAEALGWSLEDLRASFKELEQTGMAMADWTAPLVFLPFVIHDNKPESPNVVLGGWRPAFDELPDSDLKPAILAHFREYLQTLHPGFLKSYREAFPEAFTKGLPETLQEGLDRPSPKPSPIQEPSSQEPKKPEQEKVRSGKGVGETQMFSEQSLKANYHHSKSNGNSGHQVVVSLRDAPAFKVFRRSWVRKGLGQRYDDAKLDWAQFKSLCERLAIPPDAIPDGLDHALTNFLASPLKSFRFHFFCRNFEIFRSGVVNPNGEQGFLLQGQQAHGIPNGRLDGPKHTGQEAAV